MAPARAIALLALAGAGLSIAGWLAPLARDGGLAGMAALVLLLAPLAAGLRGLALGRVRAARWLSLALPFYGALFLVGAAGDPAARGWATAGAFCVALAFGAAVGWVRRGAPGARQQ